MKSRYMSKPIFRVSNRNERGQPRFKGISPHRPGGGSEPCQHPGSPGWPQQLFAVTIFRALFLRKRKSFLCTGIAPLRLSKKAFGSGLWSFPIVVLFCSKNCALADAAAGSFCSRCHPHIHSISSFLIRKTIRFIECLPAIIASLRLESIRTLCGMLLVWTL